MLSKNFHSFSLVFEDFLKVQDGVLVPVKAENGYFGRGALVFLQSFECRKPNTTDISLPFYFYAALPAVSRDEPKLALV